MKIQLGFFLCKVNMAISFIRFYSQHPECPAAATAALSPSSSPIGESHQMKISCPDFITDVDSAHALPQEFTLCRSSV